MFTLNTKTQMNYFFKEALFSVKSSSSRTLISVATIGFALFIFGIYLLISRNVEFHINKWQEEIHVELFLSDDLTLSETEGISTKLKLRDEIIPPITYISKKQAMDRFIDQGYELFFEGLGTNPLPASFQLKLDPNHRSIDAIKRLSAELLEIPGVDDVTSGVDLVEKLEVISHFIRMAGLFAGLLIFCASVFIISNTIKLSLFTKLDEIEIMKLVGATNNFVMVPYMLEGIIQGLAGSLASIALLFMGYQAFLTQLRIDEVIVLGFGTISFITIQQCINLVLVGIFIGLVGSYISVKHFLNPKHSRRLQ